MSEGISVWVPVITGIVGITGALGGQWLSHSFTSKREEKGARDRLERERYFIASELVFILERFAEACVLPAFEQGFYDDKNVFKHVTTVRPVLDLSGVTGDWRYLQPALSYRLRELPALNEQSVRSIRDAFEMDDDPEDPDDGLFEHRYQSARMGLKAIILAARLRRLCHMPEGKMFSGRFPAWQTLWQVWRRHRQMLRQSGPAHRQQNVPAIEEPKYPYKNEPAQLEKS